jgi:hypothetical protein
VSDVLGNFEIIAGAEKLSYDLVKFSGGELHPRFDPEKMRYVGSVKIKAHLRSSDGV